MGGYSLDVSNVYKQDTVKTKGSDNSTKSSEDDVDIHTQAKREKEKAQQKAKPVSTNTANVKKTQVKTNTSSSGVHTNKAVVNKPITNANTQTVSTPPSIVKTGVFKPPSDLKDFQVLKMEEKQNPVADEGGIRFYSPNSTDKNAEGANIKSKVVGENTIISLGSGKGATIITVPNDMIEKNKANGAAVVYDKATDTYAFCNLEGANVELPYQDAKRNNSFSEAKNVKGEKVFIQNCKGSTFDANDMEGVESSGAYNGRPSDYSGTGHVASSGSSESFAVFDSDVNLKASGGQDKIYAQNSTVSIEQSLGSTGTGNKSDVIASGEVRQQDNVMIASDANSKINIKYSANTSFESARNSQVYQQGYDAATFVPGWFGSDTKAGAQVAKGNATGTTAAKDGSANVAKTGDFAADARFPEFSGLNMDNKSSFRTAGGISFFAPNETDANVLKGLVNVQDNGKETIIRIANNNEGGVIAADGTITGNHGFSTIVIPNESIAKNKANGAAVIYDPKTQTYAYCNISDAKITGDHQEKHANTSYYADDFAYGGKPKLQTDGEKVYMRNCSNVTVDSNDLLSLASDHYWNGDASNDQTASLIGSGSKEQFVSIGCNDVKIIAGGDGDKVQIENSNNVHIQSARNDIDEAKMYSSGNQVMKKNLMKVDVSADAGSSMTLTLSTVLAAVNKRK